MSYGEMKPQETYMRAAIDEAKKAAAIGEVPIGAVIVKDGVIVSTGYNRTEIENDPTMHAEIIAIRAASEALHNWRLTGCELYVTSEPCIMCAGAILLSRLSAVYAGTDSPIYGAAGSVADILHHGDADKPVYDEGILKEECVALLKDFFKDVRNRRPFRGE